MFESEILIKSAFTLAINLVVAIIALYIATVKFRAEKWWDKEFQCYMEAIELLNGLMKTLDEVIQFNNSESSHIKADLKRLFEDFSNYKMRLGGIATVGKFLLHEESHGLVVAFDTQLYSFDIGKTDSQSIAVIRDDAEGCLNQFVQLAERDLKKNSFLRRW